MTNEEFKQNIAIALASNEEFMRQSKNNYNGKMAWFSVSEQINATVEAININQDKK